MPSRGVGIALQKIRDVHRVPADSPLGDIEVLLLSRIFGLSFAAAAKRCEDLRLLPRGGARSLDDWLKKEYGSAEKRADAVGLPPRPKVDFPRIPERLLVSAIEQIRAGKISVGKASAVLGIPISDLLAGNKVYGPLKIIFDASSLINLIKAEALGVVLELERHTFLFGPLVEGECGDVPELTAAVDIGSISRADDNTLPGDVFAALLNQYDLSDGETECLAFADHDAEFVICCDDGAARAVASDRFGDARVIGSLFLLRECVREHLLTAEQALLAYELMRYRGGFLPGLRGDYFAT